MLKPKPAAPVVEKDPAPIVAEPTPIPLKDPLPIPTPVAPRRLGKEPSSRSMMAPRPSITSVLLPAGVGGMMKTVAEMYL
ncbi:hypothetical protein B0H10DRAFT_2214472 [Mycena sp. CBHHK59/15]|nr:hypothetical protein B0H10DRAFT_2214472 [Mycena sp. CBHHK59/15]